MEGRDGGEGWEGEKEDEDEEGYIWWEVMDGWLGG